MRRILGMGGNPRYVVTCICKRVLAILIKDLQGNLMNNGFETSGSSRNKQALRFV